MGEEVEEEIDIKEIDMEMEIVMVEITNMVITEISMIEAEVTEEIEVIVVKTIIKSETTKKYT